MAQLSKADIHIHTTFSDGLNDPEAVVNYVAMQTDLSVIAITDHNTIDGARAAHAYWQKHQDTFSHLDVIIGIEISSAVGHILALFVEEDIPQGMSAADTVQAIHEQGGLAIAAHPFTHLLPFTDFEGIGREISTLPLDGVEARSSVPTELYANWMTSAYNQRHAQHAELGSSDAHYLTMIGKTYTYFEGQTAADFRQAVEAKTVRPGGRINSPKILFEVGKHLLDRRQVPLFLPQDKRHLKAAPGLEMGVNLLRNEQIAMLRCRGQISRENADALRKEVAYLLASQFRYVLLDLAAVDFIDSAGIGGLLSAHKQAQAAQSQTVLCNVSPTVMRTLKLMRLDTVFTTAETTSAARQQLNHHLGLTSDKIAPAH